MLTVKLVILFFLSLIAAAPIDKVEPPITHVVTFHVNQGSEPIGNMTLGLFGSVAPKTVENFFQLATMQNGFGYHKNIFHRVIKDFMIQGGDFENHDGTGGHSIYGTHKGALPDENFHLKHDRPGRLAMANSGKNTGGSQFFITSGEASWLDGHHVVFGQLIDGTETFKQIEEAPTTQFDKPMTDIVISTVSFEKRSLNGTALKDNDGTPDASDSTSGEASDPKDDDTTEKSSHHDYGLIALIALGIGALIVGIKYRAAIKNKITSLGYKRLF